MGSSCINNNNNNIKTKKLIINLYGCSEEAHNSLKLQNNYKEQMNEDNFENITTKQITQINESIKDNNNILERQKTISKNKINEEVNYEIIPIKNSDKEKIILNKLYNNLEEKEMNKNKNGITEVIIKYNNGEKYIGEYDRENLRNGRGIQIFNNNNIYYGFWEKDKMNGMGKMIKMNRKINDLSTIFNSNLIPYYYGEWKNNLEDGKGEEKWRDNSLYKGEYKEGNKQGIGEMIFPDGTIYEGEFSKGKIEGNGKMKYKDGRIYEGSWTNNKMNGEGQFTWPDGRVYKGDYLNNCKSGYGEFLWADGKIYKGMWTDGKQNGKGKLYIKEYDIWIDGIWKNGKRIKKE